MRDFFRSLPVFACAIADFDTGGLPEQPAELFAQWLRDAADAGVQEPHAMTLSTIDASGVPNARVLILKDLDESGWCFATSADSAKGVRLAACPDASLTFYWSAVGRQVRVRGFVAAGSAQLSAQDFLARSAGARAVALVSKASQPLTGQAACVGAVADAERRILADPDIIAPHWRV